MVYSGAKIRLQTLNINLGQRRYQLSSLAITAGLTNQIGTTRQLLTTVDALEFLKMIYGDRRETVEGQS